MNLDNFVDLIQSTIDDARTLDEVKVLYTKLINYRSDIEGLVPPPDAGLKDSISLMKDKSIFLKEIDEFAKDVLKKQKRLERESTTLYDSSEKIIDKLIKNFEKMGFTTSWFQDMANANHDWDAGQLPAMENNYNAMRNMLGKFGWIIARYKTGLRDRTSKAAYKDINSLLEKGTNMPPPDDDFYHEEAKKVELSNLKKLQNLSLNNYAGQGVSSNTKSGSSKASNKKGKKRGNK